MSHQHYLASLVDIEMFILLGSLEVRFCLWSLSASLSLSLSLTIYDKCEWNEQTNFVWIDKFK